MSAPMPSSREDREIQRVFQGATVLNVAAVWKTLDAWRDRWVAAARNEALEEMFAKLFVESRRLSWGPFDVAGWLDEQRALSAVPQEQKKAV